MGRPRLTFTAFLTRALGVPCHCLAFNSQIQAISLLLSQSSGMLFARMPILWPWELALEQVQA